MRQAALMAGWACRCQQTCRCVALRVSSTRPAQGPAHVHAAAAQPCTTRSAASSLRPAAHYANPRSAMSHKPTCAHGASNHALPPNLCPHTPPARPPPQRPALPPHLCVVRHDLAERLCEVLVPQRLLLALLLLLQALAGQAAHLGLVHLHQVALGQELVEAALWGRGNGGWELGLGLGRGVRGAGVQRAGLRTAGGQDSRRRGGVPGQRRHGMAWQLAMVCAWLAGGGAAAGRHAACTWATRRSIRMCCLLPKQVRWCGRTPRGWPTRTGIVGPVPRARRPAKHPPLPFPQCSPCLPLQHARNAPPPSPPPDRACLHAGKRIRPCGHHSFQPHACTCTLWPPAAAAAAAGAATQPAMGQAAVTCHRRDQTHDEVGEAADDVIDQLQQLLAADDVLAVHAQAFEKVAVRVLVAHARLDLFKVCQLTAQLRSVPHVVLLAWAAQGHHNDSQGCGCIPGGRLGGVERDGNGHRAAGMPINGRWRIAQATGTMMMHAAGTAGVSCGCRVVERAAPGPATQHGHAATLPTACWYQPAAHQVAIDTPAAARLCLHVHMCAPVYVPAWHPCRSELTVAPEAARLALNRLPLVHRAHVRAGAARASRQRRPTHAGRLLQRRRRAGARPLRREARMPAGAALQHARTCHSNGGELSCSAGVVDRASTWEALRLHTLVRLCQGPCAGMQATHGLACLAPPGDACYALPCTCTSATHPPGPAGCCPAGSM